MIFSINKNGFLEKLTWATHFTTGKVLSSNILQGVYLKIIKNELHIYASNLSSFFHTKVGIKSDKAGEADFIIDPKKIIDFISLLSDGDINIETGEKKIIISAKNNTGTFSLLVKEEFPMPPKITGKEQKIKTSFFIKKLPLVLFCAATDETRPTLTGVNFLTNEEMTMVSTDGFRLSVVKSEKEIDIPSSIIPADFLNELARYVKDEEISMIFSQEEKMLLFRAGDTELFSRLVDGEFPPFEKVIPAEKKTKAIIEKEDFLRNIKIVSVFARDYSNIVVLEFRRDKLIIRPRAEGDGGGSSQQEASLEGDEQTVAFNYKFILDFLNHVDDKNIIVEVLRPDAPVVFKTEKEPNFLHIIMPVRIQEKA